MALTGHSPGTPHADPHATILPRCGYGDAPCPGPPRHAARGRTRWCRSGAAWATTGAPWSRSDPRTSRRPPSPPPGSTTSATAGGRSPSGACAPPSTPRRACTCPGRIRTRGELQLILQNRLRMVDLWNEGAGRPARARARAHRGDRPRPLGHHAAARAARLRPRQPPAAAVGAAAHRPLRRRLGRPVRRRDHAHGRDGPRLHRHARERRPAPHRVHLRLRPPVLERRVHRALQRGRVHGVAQRRGPGADLRLAQAPPADAAVGGRAADDALGRQGALAPLRPAPRSSPPIPTPAS